MNSNFFFRNRYFSKSKFRKNDRFEARFRNVETIYLSYLIVLNALLSYYLIFMIGSSRKAIKIVKLFDSGYTGINYMLIYRNAGGLMRTFLTSVPRVSPLLTPAITSLKRLLK